MKSCEQHTSFMCFFMFLLQKLHRTGSFMGFVGTSELLINKRCTTPSGVQTIVRAIMKVTVCFLKESLSYYKIPTQNTFPKILVKNQYGGLPQIIELLLSFCAKSHCEMSHLFWLVCLSFFTWKIEITLASPAA